MSQRLETHPICRRIVWAMLVFWNFSNAPFAEALPLALGAWAIPIGGLYVWVGCSAGLHASFGPENLAGASRVTCRLPRVIRTLPRRSAVMSIAGSLDFKQVQAGFVCRDLWMFLITE